MLDVVGSPDKGVWSKGNMPGNADGFACTVVDKTEGNKRFIKLVKKLDDSVEKLKGCFVATKIVKLDTRRICDLYLVVI